MFNFNNNNLINKNFKNFEENKQYKLVISD